jgi:hypothetical protein
MFHTQESRSKLLTEPIKCFSSDAWLGIGYYFWEDITVAMRWGRDKKNKYRRFEIYEALIESKSILDTVFNEKDYRFWLGLIEEVAKRFARIGEKPTVKQVNDFFNEKGIWNEIEGILFQDIPTKEDYTLVIGLFYFKRIQFVAYNLKIVKNFRLNSTHNI